MHFKYCVKRVQTHKHKESEGAWDWILQSGLVVGLQSLGGYFKQFYCKGAKIVTDLLRPTGTLLRSHGDQLVLTLLWNPLVFSQLQPRQKPISRLYSHFVKDFYTLVFSKGRNRVLLKISTVSYILTSRFAFSGWSQEGDHFSTIC